MLLGGALVRVAVEERRGHPAVGLAEHVGAEGPAARHDIPGGGRGGGHGRQRDEADGARDARVVRASQFCVAPRGPQVPQRAQRPRDARGPAAAGRRRPLHRAEPDGLFTRSACSSSAYFVFARAMLSDDGAKLLLTEQL
jgi:hypothetical protein